MSSILVIEDELHLRQSIIKYLALEGMQADGAATAEEARGRIADGGYRVVVLDLNLPDGDGIELAREIPETAGIVIVSARGALNQRLEGLHAGAYAYLVKPVELAELVAIIRNITARLGDAAEQKEASIFSTAAITWKGEFSAAPRRTVSGSGECTLELPEGGTEAAGFIEFMPVGRDILACRANYAPERIPVGAFADIAHMETELSEESVILTSMQTGRCRLSETDTAREHFLAPDMLLCRKGRKISELLSLDAQRQSSMQTLCISKTLLGNILEPEYAKTLEEQLGLAGQAPGTVLRVSKMIGTLFHSCLPENADEESGQLPRIHSRIRTLMDRLAEGLALKSEPTPQQTLPVLLERIHQELLTPSASNVTLDELAARFCYSAKTLNEGFRKSYGQSIASFQLTRRMLAAHDELLHTDAPIKAIAAKYGYTYVNHFSTAFRKHFGRTPGSIRQQAKRKR
ncbi:helix-turn-helix domain-containing protein [Chlorobium sp. N1]|uniref:response regulator transcription factor n=1 Tax=Chlorobium sp. N1 TaxID=2491138 RepID=UPI00103E63A0|nr:helix-turn-helix domain-containing protein [Chlorobium sp. N1]TCD48603.1 helix-turn-helix domain-containing protein [Chlorobium sp. N1]